MQNARWNDWKWQLENCLHSCKDFSQHITLNEGEKIRDTWLPARITPYYMSLVVNSPALRKCVIPSALEFVHGDGETDDPLDEHSDSPVPGLIHRYPDRVAMLVTNQCASYCRYCTRSRVAGQCHPINVQESIDYIARTPAVRDVLITGGDPLTLEDDQLYSILERIRAIPHVEFIRVGTKVPAVLPMRITDDLCQILKGCWLSLHFTHPDECTPECRDACIKLSDAGIPLGSQTVLLKGVNDSVDTLKSLFHKLLQMRVRPYYLYQCDPITGSSHFRTSVQTGIDMIEGLRGHTSGYAVPQYVIDCPDGGGKLTLQPNYQIGREGDDLILRNFKNEIFYYPDPRGK